MGRLGVTYEEVVDVIVKLQQKKYLLLLIMCAGCWEGEVKLL